MSRNRLRLLVLTHGGIETALRRLLALDCVEIAGVFIETDTVRRVGRREKIRRSIRYDGTAATLMKFARALFRPRKSDDAGAVEAGRQSLRAIAEAHGVPVHFVANYHSPDAIALMRDADADLGVVLGTNILKESVFKIPRLGSINVHQGLAPYYRGCPAVFWELFNGEREVGLTVHFVETKVDTGRIVMQETVPLEYDYGYGDDFESFIDDYRKRLVGRCAQLVADSVRGLAEGTAVLREQDLSLGKRYRLPVKSEKDEMRRRLRARRKRLATRLVNQRAAGGR
ncbi:MAG TPA: formyltransferase family protein [Blastocatellia bacterium]|nr:formyltransferase family protein [Blastocatellia bacterium]